MKIIQVQTQAEAAGAQRVSDMVGSGLRGGGHDVRTVFMYRKTNVYDQDPTADFILKTSPGGITDQIRAAFGLIKYMHAQKPDAVITYQLWGNFFGSIGAKLSGAKCIIANQSGQPVTKGLSGVVSRIDKILGSCGFYDHNIVNSTWNTQQFSAYPKSYQNRLHRIEHGVLGPDQPYDQSTVRATFNLPVNAKTLISIGRLTPEKNHGAIIDALPQLEGVHLAIAGAGPSHDDLTAQAAKVGVSDRLHLIGEVAPDRIFEFIACGDIFVFPTLYETFGLSAAEAAIAGVPVIANDLPVLREVLSTSDEKPAALFVATPQNNGQALAHQIRSLMRNEKLQKELREAGRALAQKYAPETMCQAYAELLPAENK